MSQITFHSNNRLTAFIESSENEFTGTTNEEAQAKRITKNLRWLLSILGDQFPFFGSLKRRKCLAHQIEMSLKHVHEEHNFPIGPIQLAEPILRIKKDPFIKKKIKSLIESYKGMVDETDEEKAKRL